MFPTVTWLLFVAGLLGVWSQDYYEERTMNKRPRGRGAQLRAAATAPNGQKHNRQGMRKDILFLIVQLLIAKVAHVRRCLNSEITDVLLCLICVTIIHQSNRNQIPAKQEVEHTS